MVGLFLGTGSPSCLHGEIADLEFIALLRDVHPLSRARPQLLLGYQQMKGAIACFPLLGEGSLEVRPVEGEEPIGSNREVISQGMGDELSEMSGIGDGVCDTDAMSNDCLLNPPLQGKPGHLQLLSLQDHVQGDRGESSYSFRMWTALGDA